LKGRHAYLAAEAVVVPDTPMMEGIAMTEHLQTQTGVASGGDASTKEKAASSAQAGKHAAGEVAQTAVSKAQDVAAETKTQSANMVGEAWDQLRSHAGEQYRSVVSNLRTVADELSSMEQAGQPSGMAGELVSQAVDRTKQAASWLEARQPEDLLDEVRRFARRRPGAFLLGALGAGVVAGRLTRAAAAVHSDDNDNAAHDDDNGGDGSARSRPGSGQPDAGGRAFDTPPGAAGRTEQSDVAGVSGPPASRSGGVL